MNESLLGQEIKRWSDEVERARQELERAAKDYEAASSALGNITGVGEVSMYPDPILYGIGAVKERPELFREVQQQRMEEAAAAKQRLSSALDSLNRRLWRRDVWSGITPFIQAGKVAAPSDILNVIPAGFELDESDKAFLEDVFNRLRLPVEVPPEEEEAIRA